MKLHTLKAQLLVQFELLAETEARAHRWAKRIGSLVDVPWSERKAILGCHCHSLLVSVVGNVVGNIAILVVCQAQVNRWEK